MAVISLLVVLAALCGGATAQTSAAPCAPLPGVGCYIARPGASRLLVYHRGHLTHLFQGRYSGADEIPPELRPASAAEAVQEYDLAAVARRLDAALIVTGYWNQAVDVAAAAGAAGLPFDDGRAVIVAAHSGGGYGVLETLRGLPAVAGLSFLDCFYGEDSGTLVPVAEEAARLLRLSPAATCTGFYTSDNADRLARLFTPALADQAGRCRFDALEDAAHNSAVPGELSRAAP